MMNMMRKYGVSVFMLLLLSLSICRAEKPESIELFNGKNLKHWIPYLQSASQDSRQEFQVRDGVIHLSGQFGYLRSEEEYENYQLHVEWRWPDTTSNSGIFLHLAPTFKIWPENFECQLQAGNAGDVYVSGELTCHQYTGEEGQERILPKQKASNEKPCKEWNQADILCTGDTITIYINGELQNQITGLSRTKGFIGLQSEGYPVEFRNIVLTPIARPKSATPKTDASATDQPKKKKKASKKAEQPVEAAPENAE